MLDKNSHIPMYIQVEEILLNMIKNNEFIDYQI